MLGSEGLHVFDQELDVRGRHWLIWASRGQMWPKNSTPPSPAPSRRVEATQRARSSGVSAPRGAYSRLRLLGEHVVGLLADRLVERRRRTWRRPGPRNAPGHRRFRRRSARGSVHDGIDPFSAGSLPRHDCEGRPPSACRRGRRKARPEPPGPRSRRSARQNRPRAPQSRQPGPRREDEAAIAWATQTPRPQARKPTQPLETTSRSARAAAPNRSMPARTTASVGPSTRSRSLGSVPE